MQKKVKIKYKVVERIASYGSIGLLGLVLLVLIFPVVGDRSYATCLDGSGNEECAVSALSQEVGVTTKTAIALAMVNQVKIPDVTPKSNGATSYASTKMAVSTNSKEGYSILLQTGTTEGSLVGVTSNIEDASKITNTTKTKVTLDNLETNSYGYALSTMAINNSTTYSHVPTSSTVIYNKPDSAEMGNGSGDYPYGDEYYLAFGAKIGTTLPAGTYSGTVTVSAIANPVTVTSLYDITTMQEMTHSICENTREHYTKQLIDIRDGKSYWVAKLKDGNCWMVQNLALEIGIDDGGSAAAVSKDGNKIALTADNTDIATTWMTSSTYPPMVVNTVTSATEYSQYGRTFWLNDGLLFATPLNTAGCTVKYATLRTGEISQDCEKAGIIDVSGEEWQPTFVARNGTWTFDDGTKYTGLIAADENTKTYDSHYLLGGYYQHNAVRAGVNTTGDSSICPNGWRLPRTDGEDNNVSFMTLLREYGNSAAIMTKDPLYLLQIGIMDHGMAGITNFGTNGNIWYGNNLSGDSSNKITYLTVWSSAWNNTTANSYYAINARCVAE